MLEHVWTKTDKLHHLSRRYYGTNDYWWIIGLVNDKPTDGHSELWNMNPRLTRTDGLSYGEEQ